MLCHLCQSIDFTFSLSHQEAQDIFVTGYDNEEDEHIIVEYLVYDHHPNIEALRAAATSGCHFCNQIRRELFHIRGHELDETYHNGPIEIRYYPKVDKEKNIVLPNEVLAVAKTPIREIKIPFDIVQCSR